MLRVIGAGFGRTGTLSMKHALQTLGFGPTYHMEEVLRHPTHIAKWHRYATTGEVDWDDLFAGFGSAVDWPASAAWRPLAEHWSEAKIVLTVRDPQRWWDSVNTTIYGTQSVIPLWLQWAVPLTARFLEMSDLLIWSGTFDGRFSDRDHAIGVFERHIEDVKATVASERLLVFDVADGWPPLCDFLGVAVPDRPFPRLNDAAAMRRRLAAVRIGTRALPIAPPLTVAALLAQRTKATASRSRAEVQPDRRDR